MAGGFAQSVLSVVTDVLEELHDGGSGRACFCASVAALFASARCGHAWYDASVAGSSSCLWCDGPDGRRTVTISRPEGGRPDRRRRRLVGR